MSIDITPELRERCPEYIEKWTRIATSTDRADRSSAEAGIVKVYKAAKFKPPKRFVWAAGPLQMLLMGAVGRAIFVRLMQRPRFNGRKATEICLKLDYSSLTTKELFNPDGLLAGGLGHPDAYNFTRFTAAVNAALVNCNIGAVDINEAIAAVTYENKDKAIEDIRNQAKEVMQRVTFGQQDAFWLAVYDLFRTERPEETAEYIAPLDGLFEVAYSAGWWLPLSEICFVSERPLEAHVDINSGRGGYHKEDGPAVVYADGYKLHCWHRLFIQHSHTWIIDHPELITPDKIDKEKNLELRRIMLQRYGLAKYLQEADAKIVHRDKDQFGRERCLLQKEIAPNFPPATMVQVFNSTPEPDGTFKPYVIEVHPELRPLRNGQPIGDPQLLTCHNAIASTFGKRGEEYHPDIET